MIMRPIPTAAILALCLIGTSAHAGPKEEARAQALYKEVRCVVCQSESIADSDAAIAGDMRAAIRSGIAAGRSDEAIRQDLFARYGDYVLFRPRASKANLALWLVPPLIACLGLGLYVWMSKRPRASRTYELTDEERDKLRDIMNKPE